MKKQILFLMACAAFLAPTSGFCMENNDGQPKTPLRRILKAPEITIQLLKGLGPTDLKNTQLVSKKFCSASRFFITSIKTPLWSTDEDLIEYSETLPNLKKLHIIPESLSSNDIELHRRGIYIAKGSFVTDCGLEKLTSLTELKLESHVNITNNGIKNLTNLTTLDLETFWGMTDDGLIDLLGQRRHLKLKLLLLPETHKITDATITLLEENGVTVKESEYSVPDTGTTSSDSDD